MVGVVDINKKKDKMEEGIEDDTQLSLYLPFGFDIFTILSYSYT